MFPGLNSRVQKEMWSQKTLPAKDKLITLTLGSLRTAGAQIQSQMIDYYVNALQKCLFLLGDFDYGG